MRYWKRINNLGETTTVESYSHNLDIKEAIEITEIEFNTYITSLPTLISKPVRDLAAEIDELKAIAVDHEARLKKDIQGHTR